MASGFKKVVLSLKRRKIQGASNVRNASVSALKELLQKSSANSMKALAEELSAGAGLLLKAAPAESETRTAVRIIFLSYYNIAKGLARMEMNEEEKTEELKRELLLEIADYEKNRELALQKMAEYGSKKIPRKAVVFTHCHSHTVIAILSKAFKQHRLSRVICTEARPLMQGRLAAAELARQGVPVTLVLDCAAMHFMKEADLLLTGADAILEDGSIVNKIGTHLLSLAAQKNNVPHLVACSTHKLDPATYFGEMERIERRPFTEIWDSKPKGVQIENPAFDVTPAELVKEIITEKGVFSPPAVSSLIYRELSPEEKKTSLFELFERK